MRFSSFLLYRNYNKLGELEEIERKTLQIYVWIPSKNSASVAVQGRDTSVRNNLYKGLKVQAIDPSKSF